MIACRMGIGAMGIGAFRALGARRLHGAILTDPWAVRTLDIDALYVERPSRSAGRLASLLLSSQATLA